MIGIRQVADRITAAMFLAFILTFATSALPASRASGSCAECAAWNEPREPFRIFGNTYYVGTAALSSVLITSPYGHVLIDAGLPESASQIVGNIAKLGFKATDIKAILSSRAQFEYAGGIAELHDLTGAPVYALRPSQEPLQTGKLARNDPQYGIRRPDIPKVPHVWVVQDDQLLGVGGLRVRVLATPGASPGGASWTWDACEGTRCLRVVHADNLLPVAADRYRFKDHPDVLQAFEGSFARLEGVACELVVPQRVDAMTLARLEQNGADAEYAGDETACRQHVQRAREALQSRLSGER